MQKYVVDFCKRNKDYFELSEYNTEWILAGDYSDAIFPSERKLIEYACIELIEVFVKWGGFKYSNNISLSASITGKTENIVFPYHLFMQYYSINKQSEYILSRIFFDYVYLHIGSDIGTGTHPLIDLAHLIDPILYMSNSRQYCESRDSFLGRWEQYPPKSVIELVFKADKEDHSWFRNLPLESYDWYEKQDWEAITYFLS